MMQMIHDLIVDGRRSEILVVLPDQHSVFWWTRMWNTLYPFLPMVEYTTAQNMLKIRGASFTKAFVENVDLYPDGIYDLKLAELVINLHAAVDPEIVYSVTPIELNQRSHNAVIKPAAVLERTKRRLFSRK